MQAEAPRATTPGAREAHRYFCKVATELCAIVGHTAGVERAGKGYGMVLTQLRKSLDPVRAMKAVYVMENYGLLNLGKESGSDLLAAYSAEGAGSAAEQSDAVLPRGNLIADEELLSNSSDKSDDQDAEEVDEEQTAVDWHLPVGFQIATKPSSINHSCVGQFVFMNWESY